MKDTGRLRNVRPRGSLMAIGGVQRLTLLLFLAFFACKFAAPGFFHPVPLRRAAFAVGLLPQARALAQGVPSSSSSALARRAAGQEILDDKDMLEKLRRWKQARPEKSASKAPKPMGFAARALEPEPVPVPRTITANDAIEELMRRGQADADPVALTPQQLIMVFFTFFTGWRERNDIPGQVELTNKQKQIVILMIQTSLSTVRSARDFWPMVCSELGSGRDPEVRELVFALTGIQQ